MTIYALILTLCLSNGDCNETAPETFLSMSDCQAELMHLTETLQIDKAKLSCEQVATGGT